MTPSENPPDSLQDLRWQAWEKKNRREDGIAEKRMKVVFVVAGLILLILLLRVLLKASQQRDLISKRPTVAGLWRTDPSRYRLESDNLGRVLRAVRIGEFAMPFSGDCHSFDSSTLKELNGEGAVYGLFETDLPFRPDHYTCLYVEQTGDLRTAMLEAYDNPPAIGVTHFFDEAIASEELGNQREKELICEFNPIGNRTKDAAPKGPPDEAAPL